MNSILLKRKFFWIWTDSFVALATLLIVFFSFTPRVLAADYSFFQGTPFDGGWTLSNLTNTGTGINSLVATSSTHMSYLWGSTSGCKTPVRSGRIYFDVTTEVYTLNTGASASPCPGATDAQLNLGSPLGLNTTEYATGSPTMIFAAMSESLTVYPATSTAIWWSPVACYDGGAKTASSSYNFTDFSVCGFPQPTFTNTRVISVDPFDDEVIATSTASVFTVDAYVNADDFVDGIMLSLYVVRKSSIQQISPLMAWESAGAPYSFFVETEVTAPGSVTLSTSSDISTFLVGDYTIQGTLSFPVGSTPETTGIVGTISTYWGKFTDIVARYGGGFVPGVDSDPTTIQRTSTFIIGSSTYYDLAAREIVAGTDNLMADAAMCSPLSAEFDILGCLSFVFIPSPAMLAAVWDDLYSNILVHAPFGYITRFVAIATDANTMVEPVPLTYTFGTSAPEELQGLTLSYQIFDYLGFVSTINSDSLTSPKNIWEIIMPYINMIVGLAVLGVILSDLLAIGIPAFRGSSSDEISYTKRGTVSISQLPDQPSYNKVTYGDAQPVRINLKHRK